ncbi:hypothetical protein TIFTF001_037377 [Ficus carica]|uniref:Uncharacterized protein n=1 Tax=Ficus carica TaxID=3494 RepID=A0AA88E569_FICCA|nr:hypothetical protein TIFTF001_037377 [Ficus carica]
MELLKSGSGVFVSIVGRCGESRGDRRWHDKLNEGSLVRGAGMCRIVLWRREKEWRCCGLCGYRWSRGIGMFTRIVFGKLPRTIGLKL